MRPRRVALLTLVAMVAFAGNSLLTRAALRGSGIDAASFTAIRIVSGALALWLIVRLRNRPASARAAGTWGSALAPFACAAAFSLAYLSLTAATGALLLFGAVQVTMITAGLVGGEVPVITAVAGVSLLGESLTLRLVLASAAVLGGIALVILARRPARVERSGPVGPSR